MGLSETYFLRVAGNGIRLCQCVPECTLPHRARVLPYLSLCPPATVTQLNTDRVNLTTQFFSPTSTEYRYTEPT